MPEQFTYASAYFLSFHADSDQCRKIPSHYGYRDSSEHDTTHPSEADYSITFTRNSKSLQVNKIPLIRINYNLSTDQPGYVRLRNILKEKLREIKFPAKIYINAHGCEHNDFILQRFLSVNGQKHETGVSYQDLAGIFKNVLGIYIDKDITFHFIVCFPGMFVPNFIQQLRNLGFIKPVAVSYNQTTKVFQELAKKDETNFVIPHIGKLPKHSWVADEFGTRHLVMDVESLKAGDKFITYLVGGEVKQADYSMMKQKFKQEYGEHLCKRFALNYEVLNVIGLFATLRNFIENEITLLNRVFFLSRNHKKIEIYKNLLSQIGCFEDTQIDNTDKYANVLLAMLGQLRDINEARPGETINSMQLACQRRIKQFSQLFNIEMASIVWRKDLRR